MSYKYVYVNNTCTDVTIFHAAIIEAINNEGEFNETLSDVFKLVKNPKGSAAEYRLEIV